MSLAMNELTSRVIGAAIEVHQHLGRGLLESAYASCLSRELGVRGIAHEREVPLVLEFKGLVLEEAYRIDLLVENRLVVELKSIQSVDPIHKAQLLTYLRLSKRTLGLLLNFNVQQMRQGIHRVILSNP